MSKYENARYLIQLQARIRHECYQCGKIIEVGNYYYKEKVDMRPPSSLILREFCEKCGIKLH